MGCSQFAEVNSTWELFQFAQICLVSLVDVIFYFFQWLADVYTKLPRSNRFKFEFDLVHHHLPISDWRPSWFIIHRRKTEAVVVPGCAGWWERIG